MNEIDKEKINLQREKIIEIIKNWLREAGTPFEPVINSSIDQRDVIMQVTGIRDNPEEPLSKFFVIAPHDLDAIGISAYLKFQESDNIGFKLLLPPDKLKFVNILKIPLLLLNLDYTWMPTLENFDSLEMRKQIFFDGFSKNTFYDNVSSVMHGYEIAIAKYEEFRNDISHHGSRDTNLSSMW
jgi:hypothetical protein